MERKLKILLVEDEITSMIFLKRLLLKKEYEVKTAFNGDEALKELELERFDIILTDWMMPKLDGIELIRRIRENISPAPYIIMITALTSDGARLHSLNSGADDFITKPIDFNILIEKIEIGIHKIFDTENNKIKEEFKLIKQKELPSFVAVGIATSTGGPPTLVELIKNFKKSNNVAYFIVQHGPTWMIETFTNRLKEVTEMNVNLAANKMEINSGNIYICPGDKHLLVNSDLTITLDDSPKENFVRPSADPLFRSIANSFNEKSIVVILTGLGRDGLSGSIVIKKIGGKVIVQDPKSAVAPSMPQSVIDEGEVDYILTINQIPSQIDELVNTMV